MGTGAVEAQRQGQGQGKQPPPSIDPAIGTPGTLPPLDSPAVPPDPMRARMDAERMKEMNDDRHKKLAADVDRLLALTNELKSDVDKANKDELSVQVIRKAAEIEKLAHDVQSRMKN
jgi:outer membrane murein-binding lipoprotein Lpp